MSTQTNENLIARLHAFRKTAVEALAEVAGIIQQIDDLIIVYEEPHPIVPLGCKQCGQETFPLMIETFHPGEPVLECYVCYPCAKMFDAYGDDITHSHGHYDPELKTNISDDGAAASTR